MTSSSAGLDRFGDELNPSVIADVLQWRRHPELRRILANLRSHTNRKAFFDTFAEAVIARHLISRGCELRFEIPTPSGKRCDFEVRHQNQLFYLHIKRLDSDRPPRRMLAVSSRLRILERVKRSYVVQVHWHENLTDDQLQHLVSQAAEFITQARVGDELNARDHDGRELGGVRIIAPWNGPHVSVTIGLPSGFIDQAPRFRRLMHRAYQQFMPRAANVILIGSGHPEDEIDFENALLGSHVERWDAFPPRGKRVAHGRGSDGFWHGHHSPDSKWTGWFQFSPGTDSLRSRLWVRKNVTLDDEMTGLLQRLFDAKLQ